MRRPAQMPGTALGPGETDSRIPNPMRSASQNSVSRELLPTSVTSRRHPIHRWFNFIAGFSPEFVANCCNGTRLSEDSILLDPFAGCGTAPLVAAQMGLRAVGFEPHPVFFRIGRAKLTARTANLAEIEDVLLRGFELPVLSDVLPSAPLTFLGKLFSPPTLASLLGAREALRRGGLANDDLAFLVLSRTVDRCSHSQTDGIYKAPTSVKTALAPPAACRDILRMIREDLGRLAFHDDFGRCEYLEQSSESMAQVTAGSVSVVVTSPPYLNNFDYAEMTRMLLYFWGIANSWREISERVRTKLVINTTTAIPPREGDSRNFKAGVPSLLYVELDALVSQLAKRRRVKPGKKPYDSLIYPYFSQLTSVLGECFRCLRSGGEIHIMVADAALYGVHVRTPQIIATLLRELGFARTKCELVRRRGDRWILAKREGCAEGLGEYHVSAVR